MTRVRLVARRITPRLKYAAEILLEQLCGWELEYIEFSEAETTPTPDLPLIAYGCEVDKHSLHIPASGLLEGEILSQELPVAISEADWRGFAYPSLYEGPATSERNHALPFDVFVAAFYFLTELPLQVAPKLDRYGRYDDRAHPLMDSPWREKPALPQYAEMLRRALSEVYGKEIARKPPVFDYRITIDVDQPWRFEHKPLWANAAGFARDCLRGRFAEAGLRVSVVAGIKNDPYNVYDELFEGLPKDKTRFFFLLDGAAPEDSRFTSKNPAYRILMERARAAGFCCGVHPSFQTAENPKKLAGEKRALDDVLQQQTTISRQHFLKYRYPITFRTLLENGIRQDHSGGFYSAPGFRFGMAEPFKWYDLEREETTDLVLWPTHVMDRTLLSYLRLTPEAAAARTLKIIATVRETGGTFVWLLHNELFASAYEWKGWRERYFAPVFGALQG